MGTAVGEALIYAGEALHDDVIDAQRAGEQITPASTIERVDTPAASLPCPR